MIVPNAMPAEVITKCPNQLVSALMPAKTKAA